MISLEQVKYQCRIEHDEEDELLESYIKAAYDYAANYTGIKDIESTPSIDQACLMLIAHWHANREAVLGNMVNVVELPMGVHHLLQPYRLMGV